jgi:hypothetical protein
MGTFRSCGKSVPIEHLGTTILTVGGAAPPFANPADELLGFIACCCPSLTATPPSIMVERWLVCKIPFGPPGRFLSGSGWPDEATFPFCECLRGVCKSYDLRTQREGTTYPCEARSFILPLFGIFEGGLICVCCGCCCRAFSSRFDA